MTIRKFTCLFAVLLCAGALPGQQHLLHNDRVGTRSEPVTINPDWAPFYHGVASGDPLEDRVIIWTRVTPEDINEPVEVSWRVATDTELSQVLQSGTFTTDAIRDFTVKVDVTGLQPGQTYYYGFSAFNKNSLTGKAKTVPTGSQVEHLKFGVVSCSNFQSGYFNAYQRLAERNDLDAVIHLGDYIYEYPDRAYGDSTLFDLRPILPPNEIVTLEEYRTRYSTYRLDSALARVHQQHTFITVWDDHESANDAYADGAQNHNPATEGEWAERKAAAKQAYFEWLPIRDTDELSVFRKISYGSLMDLIMLDTRLEGRERQVPNINDPALHDPERTILGAEQREWFFQQLANSQARWKVVGQQVMFAEFNIGWAYLANPSFTFESLESIFLDIWDGYPAERSRVIDFIRDNDIDNVVILTGDFHSAFAFDVPETPAILSFQEIPGFGNVPTYAPSPLYNGATGEGAVAVEFVTPSITSPNFDENIGATAAFILQVQINIPIQLIPGQNLGNANPHMKFRDLIQHGYFILDLKPERTQADWFFSPINVITPNETFAGAWLTEHQANRLSPAAAPSAPKLVQDIPAPADPPGQPSATGNPGAMPGKFALLAVYPNPFREENTLHYSISQQTRVKIVLHNSEGKLVRQVMDATLQPGVFTLVNDFSDLPAGAYWYQILADGKLHAVKVIKQ